MNKEKIKYYMPLLVTVIIIIALLLIPTGYEDAVIYKGADRSVAEIIETDNSMIVDTGLVRTGQQLCKVKFTSGIFKGYVYDAVNMLSGSLEQDKLFVSGDKALSLISHKDNEILSVSLIDHYRINWEVVLCIIFIILLIAFAKETGLRALISFILSILCIWKILIPFCLKGVDPVLSGMFIVLLLSFLIVSLVYGFNKKALTAFIGISAGIIITALMGVVFTDTMKIHGAVMSHSESLLYSGFQHLNLTRIFMASIFIGSSGAVMDLAVDITSAMHELAENVPDLTRKQAIKSGMNIGRAATGTITTTLLLAYSGSCLALLMVFMAQGTPLDNIVNYKYVSAEIVHTIVGSIGLITVAPLTAVAGGLLLVKNNKA